MARPNPLDDPDFAQRVAEAFASGGSRQEIADAFGLSTLETVTRWRKDPRVRAKSMRLIEDRIIQITRKVDSSIEGRLQDARRLSVKELLAIRREFLGGTLRAKAENIDDETIGEAYDALDQNPGLQDELDKVLAAAE